MADKYFPKVGDKLYLSQRTGNSWIDMVKTPYTVIGVTKTNVFIQACRCIFPTPRYFDTLPTSIEADPNGEIVKLNWAPKRGKWQIDRYQTGYPEFAYFGEWLYQPYLD